MSMTTCTRTPASKVASGLAIAAIAALAACGDSGLEMGFPGVTAQESVAVSIPAGAGSRGAQAFGSNPLVIQEGSTVVWTNDDTATHTLRAANGEFLSPALNPHDVFRQTFNTAKVVPYYCQTHPTETGTIQVTEKPIGQIPTPSPLPSPSPLISPIPSPTLESAPF